MPKTTWAQEHWIASLLPGQETPSAGTPFSSRDGQWNDKKPESSACQSWYYMTPGKLLMAPPPPQASPSSMEQTLALMTRMVVTAERNAEFNMLRVLCSVLLVVDGSITNDLILLYTHLEKWVPPAKHVSYWASRAEEKQGKGDPQATCSSCLGPTCTHPHLPHHSPECFFCWDGEKVMSDLWKASDSSTTQAATSWVNFRNIFTVASRIHKPLREQIYQAIALKPLLTSSSGFISSPGPASQAVWHGRKSLLGEPEMV